MNEIHLSEVELTCSKDGFDADYTEHLRWCARCRSLAAEYRWLDGQIAEVLALASEVVPVARPKWRVVKRRVSAGRQRMIAGWRVSTVASIALAFCMLLSISSVVGITVATQLASPEAVVTPAVILTEVVSDGPSASEATSTPVVYESVETPSAPALAPIPTPPTSDA